MARRGRGTGPYLHRLVDQKVQHDLDHAQGDEAPLPDQVATQGSQQHVVDEEGAQRQQQAGDAALGGERNDLGSREVLLELVVVDLGRKREG